MASSHPHCSWEASTFHFNSPNKSEDWRTIYTRAHDYLDALDIEPDQADDNHQGWKQLKLMFEGEDRQALQTLIDNSGHNARRYEEAQCCPGCHWDYNEVQGASLGP